MILSLQNEAKIEEKMMKMRATKQYIFASVFIGFLLALASENGAKIHCFSDIYRQSRFCKNHCFS